MASMNRVFLQGRLTRDPEMRHLPSGIAVTEFGLAVDDSYKNRDTGEWVDRVCFVDIVVWGKQAEACVEHLSKGTPTQVEGKLQMDRWETKEGEKRSKLRVRAERVLRAEWVQFLGTPGERKDEGPSDGSRRQDEPPPPSPSSAPPAEEDDDDLPF